MYFSGISRELYLYISGISEHNLGSKALVRSETSNKVDVSGSVKCFVREKNHSLNDII